MGRPADPADAQQALGDGTTAPATPRAAGRVDRTAGCAGAVRRARSGEEACAACGPSQDALSAPSYRSVQETPTRCLQSPCCSHREARRRAGGEAASALRPAASGRPQWPASGL